MKTTNVRPRNTYYDFLIAMEAVMIFGLWYLLLRDWRSALLTGYDKASPTEKSRMWASMVHSLYEEYGVYYYCPQFILNGLGEQAEEISRLVAQVMAERQEGEK